MFPAHQLQLEQLACQRGDRVLFTDLSLQFQSGDFVQIEGHNGIGKTSLLRILAGLAQPVEGKFGGIQTKLQNNAKNTIISYFILVIILV